MARDRSYRHRGWLACYDCRYGFHHSAAHTIAVANFGMKMSAIVNKDAGGPAGPTLQVMTTTTFTQLGAVQTFLTTAVNTGMGQFGFTPSFQLAFPANTYAGTYVSTVTVTIITAP